MNIPFSPPLINNAVIEEVTDALNSGWITTGPKVKRLEELVCEYTSAPNALCVNSATSGLMLALKWFGVKQGDEVIIPAYTYAATALAVIHVGATPVMVDVKEDFNISAEKVKAAITPRTKVIFPVDIAGWPCDYNELKDVVESCSENFIPETQIQEQLGRILIVSDSAHSIGATYQSKQLGTVADITVFSFHAVKNITTAEGGVLCISLPQPFDNEEVYKFLRCYSLNGQTKDAFTKSKAGGWRYDIIYPGLKINMPDVLAAIGVAQLPLYFSEVLQARKQIFEVYNNGFKGQDWAILPPFEDSVKSSSCHLYALRIKDCTEAQRDAIIQKISSQGVAVNVHFQPLPLLSLFKELGYDISDFPVAFNNYKCEISLPIYPQLTSEELHYIIEIVKDSVASELC
ncbi:MAG TPA: DegT/DnrJ/EryC1/StrS aminotransferase family protein [Flavobacteriaceae bacterium]|nr:DegT/DnrJ/EryC1/StrS aminotransferase family protein [Flavobacteriaceae bacterium]